MSRDDILDFYMSNIEEVNSYDEKMMSRVYEELCNKKVRRKFNILTSFIYDEYIKSLEEQEIDKYHIENTIEDDEDLKDVIKILQIIDCYMTGKVLEHEHDKLDSVSSIGSYLKIIEKTRDAINYLLYVRNK